MSDAKAELTVDGDDGKLKIEGQALLVSGKSTREYDIMIDHKNGTMLLKGRSQETLKFDIKDKKLRITDAETPWFKGIVFTKK